MVHESTGESPTPDDYQVVIEHIAALGVYLEVLEQAADVPARDDAWGRQARNDIGWARAVLLALLYGVKTHCLLSRYFLDYEKMDGATDHFRERNKINPDDDLEALIPTARQIQTVLAARSTCACMLDTAQEVVAALEAVRGLAPRAQTH